MTPLSLLNGAASALRNFDKVKGLLCFVWATCCHQAASVDLHSAGR